MLLPALSRALAARGLGFHQALFVPPDSQYAHLPDTAKQQPSASMVLPDLSWQLIMQQVWEKQGLGGASTVASSSPPLPLPVLNTEQGESELLNDWTLPRVHPALPCHRRHPPSARPREGCSRALADACDRMVEAVRQELSQDADPCLGDGLAVSHRGRAEDGWEGAKINLCVLLSCTPTLASSSLIRGPLRISTRSHAARRPIIWRAWPSSQSSTTALSAVLGLEMQGHAMHNVASCCGMTVGNELTPPDLGTLDLILNPTPCDQPRRQSSSVHVIFAGKSSKIDLFSL